MRPGWQQLRKRGNRDAAVIVCGRKFCTRCGRFRLVTDFACSRREPLLLTGACRACTRHAERNRTPEQIAHKRAYAREYGQWRRKLAGVPTRAEYEAAHSQAARIVLGRMYCTRCGRWRPVSDYAPQRTTGRLYPRCDACVRVAARERYARLRQDPEWLERHREYGRIYAEVQRRRAGVPVREFVAGRAYPPASSQWVTDAEPLRALVRQYEALEGEHIGQRPESNSLRALAEAAGVSDRLLRRLRNGDGAVSVNAADRLVTALGLHLDVIAEGAGL